MNETIEDGIGQGWVADGLVPVLDWQLACDDRGGAAMAVFEDFQQVTTFRGCEDGEAPIVDDQHIHAGDGFEDAFMAAIPACKSEGFEHARGALIEDRPTVTARLMAKGAGDPAFAQTGGSSNQQVLMTGDPTTIRKMGHDTAVNAAWRAQVEIFNACILAQGGELEPRRQLFGVTFSGLAIDQQAKAFFERQVIEGGRPALLFKRLGNAGQAPKSERRPAIGRGWDGSAFWSFLSGNSRRRECWRAGGGQLLRSLP